MKSSFLLGCICFICLSCGQDPVPKPQAYLRLEYPKSTYQQLNTNLPFSFEKNTLATQVKTKVLNSNQSIESYGITLQYPKLNGAIYLTYKQIDNNKERLISYLRDAQKFTQEHTRKADEIIEQPYQNKARQVYGMFYEVGGNAASQSQFYVTDSIHHFLTGSLYFYTTPNYDSIYPAAKYLEKDIKRIMETITWENTYK